MIDIFLNTFDWIQDDWKSNKVRFVVEVLAWLISIGCSLVMAITVPNPPLLALYSVWITGCAMYAGSLYPEVIWDAGQLFVIGDDRFDGFAENVMMTEPDDYFFSPYARPKWNLFCFIVLSSLFKKVC